MGKRITRRDFFKDVGVAGASSLIATNSAKAMAADGALPADPSAVADENAARLSAELPVHSVNFKKQTAVLKEGAAHRKVTVKQNQNFGPWTLMAVIQNPRGDLAVFETLKEGKGSIVYAGAKGVVLVLPKSLKPTTAADPSKTYRGRTVEEIAKSKEDVLSKELLAGKDDPNPAEVAAALPPLRVPSFVATRESDDKPTYEYGGFSDEIYVDVGKLFEPIRATRAKNEVLEGLVGGWLPVNRFVFPQKGQEYWEETMFALEEPGHFWTQPVWYRVLHVDGDQLKAAHYYYHHLPFPPRGEPAAFGFYKELFHVHEVWKRDLNPPMKVEVPDDQVVDFCRHALILEQITRVGNHPKYGFPPLGGINVFGGYGYNNVDTFQDTFNTSVEVFLEWGMYDRAKGYIDDYFTHSVRTDGSIDTRGPEIGQYGKMLKVVAKYYNYSRDPELLRTYQEKLEAIVDLFYELRKQSKKVPKTDITYGIIRGWTEHDSCLKINPYRFMLPHFSNNAEVARGFHDLGTVWIEMGDRLGDAHLTTVGQGMVKESVAMKNDMSSAMNRSVDRSQNPPYMPAVAGNTPTYGKSRAYMELLESCELTKEQASIIINNLEANGHTLFGMTKGGMYYGGFLDFGAAVARLHFDWPREFLLLYYAFMSHIYSRGTWTAVEGARIDGKQVGPYCAPSQVGIPTFTKWMLVFEEPDDSVLWLAKATPRNWLEQGKKIAVANAPTRFGSIGYEIQSGIDNGKVSAVVSFPEPYHATTKLRLRAPLGKKIQAVSLNGKPWSNFSAEEEVVTIPPEFKDKVRLEISYT